MQVRHLFDTLVNLRLERGRLLPPHHGSDRTQAAQPTRWMTEGFGERARERFLRVEAAVECQIDDADVRLGQDAAHGSLQPSPPDIGHDALALQTREARAKIAMGNSPHDRRCS